jgi:mitogen-activated protein kinase kinase kinase
MRKAVKFTEETGASKMIAVSDCKNGREVLVRALRKFQRLTGTSGAEVEELEEWGVFATTSDGRCEYLLSLSRWSID